MRQLLVSALALTTVALGVFAYSEHSSRLASEEQVRSLQDRLNKLAKIRPAPAVQLAPAMPQAMFPAGMVTPAEASEGPVATMAESTPGPMRSPADIIGLLDSPEVQQLMSLRGRGALDSRYAALFKSLGLPPDQLQKFQQLLLDKQSTMRDVLSAMRSQGLMPSRENAEQMRTLFQNANAEIDSQIQSALGPAAYAQYQSYEQTQPQRATVERVQQRLSYTSQPLTEQQATQLVTLMAQNAQPSANTAGVGGGLRRLQPGGSTATAPITDQTLQQASAILSPDQLTALQELQQEQQAQAQLGRRGRGNSAGPRPTTPTGN